MLAVVLGGLIAGCGPVVVKPTTAAPVSKSGEYRIGQGDEVEIGFLYAPELNLGMIVRSDGKITLPLVGDVHLAGLTVEEAMAHLRALYEGDLKRPEATVNVRRFASRKVFVGGEVGQPGTLPFGPDISIMQAIMDSGGLKDTARMDEVVVIRRAESGERQVFSVDLGQVISGEDLDQDITLHPLDLVFVPRSAIAAVNVWVDLHLTRTIPLDAGFTYGVTQTVDGP